MGFLSGITDTLFGSEAETERQSMLSPEQQKLLTQTSKFLQEGLGMGATATQQPLYTDAPDYYSQSLQALGLGGAAGTSTVLDALKQQAGGVGAYQFDPGQVTKQWNETFAQPVMSAYRQYVSPLVEEKWNIPGLSGSAIAARGVTNAAQQYFGQQIQPTLYRDLQTAQQRAFQSQEAAAGRQLAGASALGQLPISAGQTQLSDQERILAALRGDESRMMMENNPYLQAALGLSTAGTYENIVHQGQEGMFGPLLGMAGAGAAGGLLEGGGLSGALSGASGALLAFSDERIKENIKEVPNVSTKLKKIKLRTYNFVGDDQSRIGLLAQEVEKEFPEAVVEKDGIKQVDLYALQSIIITAIGEVA
jgi:hypothetical protein